MGFRRRNGAHNPNQAEAAWAEEAHQEYKLQVEEGIEPQVPSESLLERGRALSDKRYKILEAMGIKIIWPATNKPQMMEINMRERQ